MAFVEYIPVVSCFSYKAQIGMNFKLKKIAISNKNKMTHRWILVCGEFCIIAIIYDLFYEWNKSYKYVCDLE